MVPAPEARAGPFISFLSDILPVREAQREVAKFDFGLRDAYSSFIDVIQERKPRTEVPDAPGAEAMVFRAADAAAQTLGVDVSKIAALTSEFEATEARRLRGRSSAGEFESDIIGSTTSHMASSSDSPAFRAFCHWRAYLSSLRSPTKEAALSFRAELGRRLAAEPELAAARVANPPVLQVAKAESLLASLRALCEATVAVGLCTKAYIQVDEVLQELWTEGSSRDLAVLFWVEGDPLVDAQILLKEEFAATIIPDPVQALLEEWLRSGEEAPGANAGWSVQQFYVNAWARRKSEREQMAWVPKQKLFQVTLQPGAAGNG